MVKLICPECGYENDSDARYCDDCGALLETLDQGEDKAEDITAPISGDLIEDRYEIVEVLSHNSNCSKFTAIDLKNDNNIVWIKSKTVSEDDEEIFDNQIELLNILKDNEHPNIVRIVDVFRTENKMFTVYENLKGQNLETLIQKKGQDITEEHILPISIQAAKGLKHLHDLNILHMDIEPTHLFLTDKGVLKISGFGRICSINKPYTDNTVTEGFSPPESFGLMGGKIGVKSDIFSLGATLYYLATNSKPRQFSREHSFTNFIPIDDAERKISKALEKIILKATKKEPEKRFKNIDELLEILIELEETKREEVLRQEHERLDFDIYTKSHVGKVRDINQDSCFLSSFSAYEKSRLHKFTLMVVSDGMGGVAEGEKASSLAIRVIAKEVLSAYVPVVTGTDTIRLYSDDDLQDKASYILKRAINMANSIVFEYSQEDVSRKGMGATLTGAFIEKDNMCVAHAGDTRCYLHNDEEGLIQITEDHSLVGRLVRMGQLTREEAMVSPQRSAIYRALGTSPELEIDFYRRTLKRGDLVLICTDGVWEYFPDKELIEIINTYKTPRAIGDILIEKCLERGADDNATLIIFRVLGKESLEPEEVEEVEEVDEVEEEESEEMLEVDEKEDTDE